MFVEGILKKKYYLSKENKGSVLADPIPVKVTASTMKDSIMYWLECLQTYMRKKRVQKKSQPVKVTADLKKIESAIKCAIRHTRAFSAQSAQKRIADYGEPCENCEQAATCHYDWFTTMQPLLDESLLNGSKEREYGRGEKDEEKKMRT